MGWEMPWYTITDGFDADFGVDEWHGHNVFFRDGERVFRTYFINSRGDEAMGTTWSYLDITPLGRQETWEDSPEGYPQTPPYKWWNWHDNYDAENIPDPKWIDIITDPARSRSKARGRGESRTDVRKERRMTDFMGDALGAPKVVDRNTFHAELDALRVREKAHTREGDVIAAARRRLPMVAVDGATPLIGERGAVTLLDVFEGRRMLIAYYFMWNTGQPAPEQCEGCTWVTSQVRELSYIHSRHRRLRHVLPRPV
jgi:predicted dithiol-disulfide oxidoreductase (DUF899 family)